jgi:uracil-DNA glycosylase family 4
MSERKHPMAKCEDCPLATVGRYVPSRGPEKARIAVVGEAPGRNEAAMGKPFIGPSGKLLDKVLDFHGIDKEEVLYTNAVACRPPDNGTPPKSAIAACRSRLDAELVGRDVKVAVLLGNSATESVLGQSGVTRLRIGPPKQADRFPDLRVVPTYHPAACLRQADFFPTLVTDVGKVVNEAPIWVPPQYIVADDEDSALSLLDQVAERTNRVVVDIEVDIDKDTSFDHPTRYGMLCVGIGYAKGKVLVLGETAMGSTRVRERLGALLRSVAVGAQNGKFDLAGLYPLIGDISLAFDTMLASYVFDERPGIHGLKFQGQEYLGMPDWERELDRYDAKRQGYGVIPKPVLYKYNAYDCAGTWDLWDMYEARFAKPGNQKLREVHDMLCRASNQLKFLELNGIGTDKEYLLELQEEFLAELERLGEKIDEVVKRTAVTPFDTTRKGCFLNPNSPKQIKEYLASVGINVDSTNEDTMTLLREKMPHTHTAAPFIDLLMENRKVAKGYGTYVKGILKRRYGGKVFSTYMLHGTTTGRLSSRNPNLQNIPRDKKYRRMFIPTKPENVFVHTDYSQAELRVLTYLAQDEYFRAIFNDPTRDIFDELTPVLYPYADKATMSAPEWKELRIRVKAYVYGLAYGRSEFSIADEFRIPVPEAREGMHAFFNVIPDIVKFRDKTRGDVLAGKVLETPWGRRRRFTLITNENRTAIMNEALAFLPQSTASDMTLNALIEIRPALKGIAIIRNIIHDALIAECHPEDVAHVQEVMNREMLKSAHTIVGDYVMFATDTTVGKSWGDV